MSVYRIRFRARAGAALPTDVADRLSQAIDDTASTELSGPAEHDPEARVLTGGFDIEVPTDKMVDAARYGSRLAKESLWSANVDAKLIELFVTRTDDEASLDR